MTSTECILKTESTCNSLALSYKLMPSEELSTPGILATLVTSYQGVEEPLPPELPELPLPDEPPLEEPED